MMTEEPQASLLRQGNRYTESHQMPGKGEAYDAYYTADPEMRYLWLQEQQVLRRILKEFYSGRPVHLLDFACGTGRILNFLESQVASSCGVDVSDSMLAVARPKVTRSSLLKVNLVQECPFRPRSFNLISAFRFFLNAEPELRIAAVKALEPLLAEDGYLVFNIHQNKHSLYYWPTEWYCRLRHLESARTLTIAECATLLGQVGLKICRIYSVGLLHLPKQRFPERVRQWVDRVAVHWSALGGLSDSPIMVAGRPR